jgi:hypothetical protein
LRRRLVPHGADTGRLDRRTGGNTDADASSGTDADPDANTHTHAGSRADLNQSLGQLGMVGRERSDLHDADAEWLGVDRHARTMEHDC